MSPQDGLVVRLTEGEMEQGAGCSACTCNHSAGRQKQVISELEARPGGRHSEFQDSRSYTARPRLENNKRKEIGIWKAEKMEPGAVEWECAWLKSAWSHGTWSPEGRGDGRMGTAPSPPPLC